MKEQLLTSFKHVFKLDPNRPITEEQIKRLCESGTDAVMIGGTLGITYEETSALLKMVRKHSIVVIQEISDMQAIVPGFDYYFIPLVLNAQNPDWILNAHQQALKVYGELVNWDQVLLEGYIVLNEESSVAKLTESRSDLDLEDLIAYTRIADQLLKLPILYIEYSGQYGNPVWVREIKRIVQQAKVFYGGGIDTYRHAKEMAQYADTIIVGNLIYENFELALETVVE